LVSSIDRLDYSISYTTRLPRIDEAEGKDYFFVSHARFEEMIKGGSLVEWARVYDNYYGTSKDFINRARDNGRDVLLDVDTAGALQIKSLYPDAVLTFVLPPSLAELKRRLRDRAQDGAEIIRRRLKEARKELDAASKYDYVVLNDTVGDALRRLQAIITAERCRSNYNKHLIKTLLREANPPL
jgi:guanylate kinase